MKYCDQCFNTDEIQKFIQAAGKKDTRPCRECDSIEHTHKIDINILAEKLREVVLKVYEHEYVHGMYGSACSWASIDKDDPSDISPTVDLYDVCSDMFFEDDSNKIVEILQHSITHRDLGGSDEYFMEPYDQYWLSRCWFDHYFINWRDFSEKIKHERRFFDSEEYNRKEELSKLLPLFNILDKYSPASIVYRARLLKDDEEKDEVEADPSNGLKKAPAKRAAHNRFSPAGISYWYLAFDMKTAQKEVDEILEKACAIGTFSLNTGLKLLDLTKDRLEAIKEKYTNPFLDEYNELFVCELRFIEEFIVDIQKPISEKDEVLDYIPSQVLAEFIALNGYDGFVFNSSKNDGINLVLFEDSCIYIEYKLLNM